MIVQSWLLRLVAPDCCVVVVLRGWLAGVLPGVISLLSFLFFIFLCV